MNTSDLDAALLAAHPEPPSTATMDVAWMLASESHAAAVSRGTARLRRRRLGKVGVLAFGLLGTGLLTGAGVYAGTHTGIFGNPFTSTEESDASEYFDIQAADFPDAVRSIAPDYVVYPGGINPTDVTEAVIANAQAAGAGMAQESGLIANFEGYAYCSWAKTWVAQYDAGDVQGTADAALHLRESTQYPATGAADGGGVIDHKHAVADAADRGDRAVVQAELDSNCGLWGKAGQP